MSTSTLASLSGELGLIGLFDLGQLLLLNGATGRLVIHQGQRRAFLIFEDGRIVNAVDDEKREGETAAYEIFTWTAGRFEFRPERPGSPRKIEVTTEALMLEAARRIDESGDAAEAEGGSAEERLLNRRGAMEELRDVFHRLAREAKRVGAAATEPADLLLEELREVDDRLYCRRGRAARIFHDGAWLTAGELLRGQQTYEDLRSRLIGASDGPADTLRGVTRLVTMEDGRQVAVTVIGEGAEEALWVRLLSLPAPDPSLLDGPWERLHPIVDLQQGLVMAAGPTPEAVERLLHALVALVERRRAGTTLLVTRATVYAHDATEGLVLQTDPGRAHEVLLAIQPAVVAFEPSAQDTSTVRHALRATPLLLFGVICPELERASETWLTAFTGDDRESATAVMSTRPWAVVYSNGVPMGQERIPFDACLFVPEDSTLADTPRRRETFRQSA
ncbi:MAG TPA: DUF4388 domain-containing protein [Candidatus Eisenbacteria bacterium]|nr:DUF4388 domain-containing protein [Candidatus Eisenbacteria bacterium]